MRINAFICIPVFAAGIFFSCEKQPVSAGPSPVAAAASNAPDATYTVRALIERLPTPDGKQFLKLHHEEIPAFKDKGGKVVGMKEMIMDFPTLADGVSLTGFSVNDPVEVSFEVRWNVPPRMRVSKIAKLPPDTKLKLSPARQGN